MGWENSGKPLLWCVFPSEFPYRLTAIQWGINKLIPLSATMRPPFALFSFGGLCGSCCPTVITFCYSWGCAAAAPPPRRWDHKEMGTGRLCTMFMSKIKALHYKLRVNFFSRSYEGRQGLWCHKIFFVRTPTPRRPQNHTKTSQPSRGTSLTFILSSLSP